MTIDMLKKNYRCPCCGASLDGPLGNAPTDVHFGAIQQRLWNVMQKVPDGIGREDLYERVFGANSERSLHLISTMIWQMNQKIKVWGVRIKGSGGPGSTYHLLQIK